MPFLAQEHVPIPIKDILSWIFDDLSYDQDKPIYIDADDPTQCISARQAQSLIRKLAAGLRKAGLKYGDCVCVHSFNDIYYPILVLGIIAAGGVFIGTNPAYTPYELSHHVKTTKAKIIIAEPSLMKVILDAIKDLGIPKSKVYIFDTSPEPSHQDHRSWTTLLRHNEADWPRFNDLLTCRTTTAMRLTSSGTTGLPKAVELSHHNLIAQHTVVWEHRPVPYAMRKLIALPMFHAAVAPVCHTSALRAGDVTYIMRRFDLEPFLNYIEKYQIRDLVCVPPIVIRTITSPLAQKYSLKSVRCALVGAAPLDKGAQARFKALLAPDATMTQVWGMTESSCIATRFYYPEDDVTGSVGRPVPNLDIKIVDDAGREIVGLDTPGEACIRGPTVVRGYFENEEANRRDWDAEGFWHTGDVVYCDGRTGLWYIVDRKKELLKVRGFQVAPPELEGVLISHPQIVDAAVIGIQLPSDESELPRAYIVRNPETGDSLTEAEVKRYMAERLAKYKQLEGGVVFVDAIPKTASGKILKRVLRERAKREIGARL